MRSIAPSLSSCRWARLLSVSLVAAALAGPAIADSIQPDELFFAPNSLVEAVYPGKLVSGDGANVPWTLTWTESDILALDPDRVDITIVGIEILPILQESPNGEDGEYTEEELAGITVDNYGASYAYIPGLSVYNLDCSYDADLTDNVLTVHVVSPGPYAFRVRTESRASPRSPLEPVDYMYSQLIGDAYAILPGGDPIPTHVHRVVSTDESEEGGEGGAAGDPPGVVHVVSDEDPDDNGFLTNSCETLTDQGKEPKKASTIDKLIERVCAAQAANGGNPVKVVIYAHGNGPAGDTANGLFKIGTEYVCNGGGCTKTPKQLGTALKGKVTSITLFSCYVGSDKPFCQALADASGVTISHYDIPVTAYKKSTFLGWTTSAGGFDTDAKKKKKKEAPHGCVINGCAGDLDGSGDVDGYDLAHMLRLWGEGGCSDFNDDGITDSEDLSILLGAWGACP